MIDPGKLCGSYSGLLCRFCLFCSATAVVAFVGYTQDVRTHAVPVLRRRTCGAVSAVRCRRRTPGGPVGERAGSARRGIHQVSGRQAQGRRDDSDDSAGRCECPGSIPFSTVDAEINTIPKNRASSQNEISVLYRCALNYMKSHPVDRHPIGDSSLIPSPCAPVLRHPNVVANLVFRMNARARICTASPCS